jgi:hypothetical protein
VTLLRLQAADALETRRFESKQADQMLQLTIRQQSTIEWQAGRKLVRLRSIVSGDGFGPEV